MFYSFNYRSALFLAMLELALFSLSFQDFHHMNGGYYNILVIIILFNYYFYLLNILIGVKIYEKCIFYNVKRNKCNYIQIRVDFKLSCVMCIVYNCTLYSYLIRLFRIEDDILETDIYFILYSYEFVYNINCTFSILITYNMCSLSGGLVRVPKCNLYNIETK